MYEINPENKTKVKEWVGILYKADTESDPDLQKN